ncbi:MAG: response regulator [Candidatus Promineifilaceae bacterium]|nr:response regulator [Candidatus Promineifilaceae bacterium]
MISKQATTLEILLIEDSLPDAHVIEAHLHDAEEKTFRLEHAISLEDGLQHLAEGAFSLVLLDLSLPDSQGLESLEQLRRHAPGTPVIVLTGLQDQQVARQAVSAGAQDYLLKGELAPDLLVRAISYALERHRLNQALQERARELAQSRQRLQGFFDHSPGAIVFADDRGRYVDANPAASRLLGYSREELLSLSLFDLFDSAEQELARSLWESFLQGGQQEGEVTLLRKDGSRVVCEYRAVANFVPGLHRSAMYDISARKAAEAALQKREAYFRTVIENALDITIILRPDGQILYMSPSVRRVLGYEPGALVGNSALELIHPDDRTRVQRVLEAMAQRANATALIDMRVRHRDGSWRFLESVGRNLLEEPAVGGLIVNSRDVTERKAAEVELRRSNERLVALHEVEQAILAAQSPERTARAALSRLRRLVPYVRATVLLFDLPTGEAYTLAVEGVEGLEVGDSIPLHDIGALELLRAGRYHLISGEEALAAHSPRGERLVSQGVRSFLAVPLMGREQVLGALALAAESEDAFHHEHVQIACEVSGSLAIAIQNANLWQEAQQRADQLAALYDTSLALGAALDRETLLHRLTEHLQVLLEPDLIMLVTFNAEADEVQAELVAEDGEFWPNTEWIKWPLPEAGLSGWIIRERESLLFYDLPREMLPVEPRRLGKPARSWLGVPLVGREQVLGVMAVQAERAAAFDAADRHLMEAMAAQVAAALENVRLFEETRQRTHELEALEEVSFSLRSAHERPQMFRTLLGRLHRRLDLELAAIAMVDPATKEVVAQRAVGGPEELTGFRLPPGAGIAGRIMKGGKTFVTSDLEADPDYSGPPLAEQPLAAVLLPLEVEGTVFGILMVVRPEPFNRDEVRLLAAIGDITANAVRRAMLYEQTLNHAQEVEQIIETVADGVVVLDQEQRVVRTNEVGRDYLDILGDSRAGNRLSYLGGRPVEQFVAAEQEDHRPVVELREEGRVFEVTGRPIIRGPQSGGTVLTLYEATEERRRQEFLQAQERLATVGQLAAGIAHDFNNIMAIITLYSQSLEKNPDLPKRGQFLGTISEQARHAANLISQILDFSRAAVMERQRIDLAPFVKEVVKLLRRTLPETINISLDVEAGNYVVNADPTRLQQVLMNLAVNARDAMPEGGELRIRLSELSLQPGEPPPLPAMAATNWVCLEVDDTGVGIASNNLTHVFEPFYSTKQRDKGTGLGLAQVYGIVKQHGGEINVESELGTGTRFVIYLPALSTQASKESEESQDGTIGGRGETLLLVEDDAGVRAAVRDVLEILNYTVWTADDGEEALALFEEKGQEIDLIISDIIMPSMGGLSLYHKLKEVDPLVKVILITGYPLEEDGKAVLEAGVCAWLQKPFTAEQISAVVRDAVSP